MSIGKVWLVGAGPGDPELLTLRGHHALGQADVVFHDALSHEALLEFAAGAEIRDVGKRFGKPSPTQDWITSQLIEQARLGKRVVRLKGGDPFLFARGAEEVLALRRAGIPYEVVPGIASPVAASAYAGISLTHRTLSSSVTFITGSDRAGVEWSPAAWEKLATATDTICVLMGMRRIEAITQALMSGGRAASTPAAVVQWAARACQRTVSGTLADIAARTRAEGLTNPAILIVGEVVALRDELRWFDRLPLFGKNVLVPRAEQQARETARELRARGATPVTFPVIRIEEAPDPARVAQAIESLGSYRWVVFTSANGVQRFLDEIFRQARDARAFAGARIAAIGPKTGAALHPYGLRADLVAHQHVAEALAKELVASGPLGRVLIPRALRARDALPAALKAAGAEVDVLPVYATVQVDRARGPELRRLFETRAIDAVLFTSSSTVDAVVSCLGIEARRLLSTVCVASIGPVTQETLTAGGIAVDVAAENYTLDGLLFAVERYFENLAPPMPGHPTPR